MPQASCCQLIWPVIRLNLSRASHSLATAPGALLGAPVQIQFHKTAPCTARPPINAPPSFRYHHRLLLLSPSPLSQGVVVVGGGGGGTKRRRNFARSVLSFSSSSPRQKLQTFPLPPRLRRPSQLGRIKSPLCHVKMDSPRNITKSYLTAALIEMMDNTGARDDWRQLDSTHIMELKRCWESERESQVPRLTCLHPPGPLKGHDRRRPTGPPSRHTLQPSACSSSPLDDDSLNYAVFILIGCLLLMAPVNGLDCGCGTATA